MAIMIVLSDGTTFCPANECFVINVPDTIENEDVEAYLQRHSEERNPVYEITISSLANTDHTGDLIFLDIS